MATLQDGRAIFSSSLGRFRSKQPSDAPKRIVLRSFPEEDREAIIEDLRVRFPNQCKAITSPVGDIYDYFDGYDQWLQGGMFLRAVLEEICGRNLRQKQDIFDFTQQWTHLNSTNIPWILSLDLDSAFTADDKEVYGQEFLQEALEELQLQKTKHDYAGQWSWLLHCSFANPEVVAHAYDRDHLPANTSTQNAGNTRFPALLHHGHQVDPTLQRNVSEPPSLRVDEVPPRLTPSAPSSSPMVHQDGPIRASFPTSQQRFPLAENEIPKPHPFSGPQYPIRQIGNNHYISNVNTSGCDFPDMFFAVPPPAVMDGQHLVQQHIPSAPARYIQPANRLRPFSKTKGPLYVGPSNDARILERQGVPRGHAPFGERKLNRANPNQSGPHISQLRQSGPSRQGQYAEAQQSPGHLSFPPSRLSNELVINKSAHESYIIPEQVHEEMQHARQQTMPQQSAQETHDSKEGHESPIQPRGSPHRNSASNHGAPRPSGFTDVQPTPLEMMQESSTTNQMGHYSLRRFSDHMNPPHGLNPSAQYVGQHRSNMMPRGRAFSMEDRELSDRKLWVGGLPPNTKILTLAQLLEPFGPCQLSDVMVSKKVNSDLGGFTFAEFQNSRNAARAVEALNGKDLDCLRCKLWLKPARINPKYNNQTSSAQSGIKVFKGHSNFNDVGNDQTRNLDDQLLHMPRYQYPHVQNEHYANQSLSRTCFNPHNALATQSSPPRAPSLQTQFTSNIYDSPSNASNVRDQNSSAIVKSVSDSTASPSKKKKGRTNKDGPSSGKENQAKARKEILSQLQLRTTKSSDVATNEFTEITNVRSGQHNRAPEPTVPKSKDQAYPQHQEHTKAFSGISASDLKDELEQYAQPLHIEPTEGLSRVCTTSSADRRGSSTSPIITTVPTSYAQSQQSGSGTDGVQTPVTAKDQAESMQALSTSIDSAPPNASLPYSPMDTVNIMPSDSSLPPEPLLPDTSSQPGDQARPFILAAEPPTSLQVGQDESSVGCTPVVETATLSKSQEHEQGQPASSRPSEDFAFSGAGVDTFEELRDKAESSAASLGESSPKRASAGPMQDLSPNKKLDPSTGSQVKRSLLKDPKLLIAVPKVLPFTKPKGLFGSSDVHAKPVQNLTPSIAALRPVTEADTESDLRTENQKMAVTDLKLAHESCTNQSEQPTVLPSSNDDIATGMTNNMVSSRGGPQQNSATVANEEHDPPVDQAANQQPVIQQKKRKTKKPKKAKQPKPSQASYANDSSPTHSRSGTREDIELSEEKAMTVVPKAETPYLADDNTPLPQPSFVRHNHSSMRSRIGQMRTPRIENDSRVIGGTAFSTTQSSTLVAESHGVLIYSKSPDRLGEVFWPGESSYSQSPYYREDKVAEVGDRSQLENKRYNDTLDERQARLKVLDNHVQQNNLLPVKDLLEVLQEVAPQTSEQAALGVHRGSKPPSDECSDTLPHSGEPRLLEITSDDEAQATVQPSGVPQKRMYSSVSEPLSLLPPAICAKSSPTAGSFQTFPEIEQPTHAYSGNSFQDDTASSHVSTRNSSPEPSRGVRTPPVKGVDLSNTHPTSTKSGVISPSRKEPPKTPSWKEIAIKPPTPLLQPGDVVEFIPREADGSNTGSQTSGMLRKSLDKDPWRVPSAEQPWGKNNKSKGKSTAES
ncbi:MAG: hypothetical protein Q9176_008036 [Flavoplaca citrina]